MNFKAPFLKLIAVLIAFLASISLYSQEKKDYKVVCIAFYNVENLFDTLDTPGINDHEYTPQGPKQWNTKRYFDKLDNLAEVISQIGIESTPHGPAIIGIAEIENEVVLEDLAKRESIASRNYQVVHYYGPDRRGIDVALLYQPQYFKVTNSKSYKFTIPDKDDFLSRDQLLVSGELHGELMHFIVVHWPSRRGGESKSRPLRTAAADLARHIIDSLITLDPDAKIIFMGDLNDNPDNISVTKHLGAVPEIQDMKGGDLYNPFYNLHKKGIGTLAWRDTWSLFDQIVISKPLVNDDYSTYRFFKASVFNKKFLQQPTGRFKGYPFRSHAGNQYLGGYSDHFPAYILLVREKE